jgi:NAD(P)-dependent dehydrogenase (short-subunit alcohol dehydrogenase family)
MADLLLSHPLALVTGASGGIGSAVAKPSARDGARRDRARRHGRRWRRTNGTPDDRARAVAFLGSPDAGYINGERFSIDGGWGA